jgi:hypothetical protein
MANSSCEVLADRCLTGTSALKPGTPGALVGVAIAKSRSRARRRTLMSASLSAPVIDFWSLHGSGGVTCCAVYTDPALTEIRPHAAASTTTCRTCSQPPHVDVLHDSTEAQQGNMVQTKTEDVSDKQRKVWPHLSMVSTTAGTSTRRISVSRPRYLMFGSRVLMNLASSAVAERSTCAEQRRSAVGRSSDFSRL